MAASIPPRNCILHLSRTLEKQNAVVRCGRDDTPVSALLKDWTDRSSVSSYFQTVGVKFLRHQASTTEIDQFSQGIEGTTVSMKDQLRISAVDARPINPGILLLSSRVMRR